MKRQRPIARLFTLTLILAGLMSWTLLPIHSSGQAAQAATNARLTTLTDPPAPRAVANGRIAFVSEADIYTMNPDGSDRLRLTFSPTDQSSLVPVWSPDGTQIAFQRNDKSSQPGRFQQA